MSKRERIEDLGVLLEKLTSVMNSELFHILPKHGCTRPKDFYEIFINLSEDQQETILDSIAYGIDKLEDELACCWAVAAGDDEFTDFDK